MASITQAKTISLKELKNKFNLQLASHGDFLNNREQDFAEASPFENQQLKRIQQNYDNLSIYENFSEEAVKMVVLSPLLDLAGFYQAPFSIATEEPIEISSVDESVVVRGKIDVLVVREQFWALVIESKRARFDVMFALPQAIAYMMDAPDKSKPVYGLLVNGREFVFVELSYQPEPVCARSFALSIEQDEELMQVLAMLKYLRQTVLEAN